MEPFVQHGDSEALVIHILKNLTPEFDGKNVLVRADLIGYAEGQRYIVVSQEGSSKAVWNVLNKPRVDCQVRAESRTAARDISEIAEASIFRAVGVSAYGATLSSVKEEMGITRIPDKEQETSTRYVFSLRLVCTIHPESLQPLL